MANGEQHPINSLMDTTLEKIRQMVDSNTIIGNPINTADGSTIIPVSKVSFGFTSGGSDFVSKNAPKDLFGGGSGAGVSIQPVAFLVIHEGDVRMIQLADQKAGTVDRLVNMLPEVIDKVQGFVKDKKGGKDDADSATSGADCDDDDDGMEIDEVVVVEPLL